MAHSRRRPPLSSDLAQRVVDLIAPTISHNINVMDEHGTIIACLDPERLGTLHRGAQRVIAEGRTIRVENPEPGTSDRPGVNEPLVVDGELRGVVGVTGPPQVVAALARVVALTVQLLIAQEHEQDAATRRHTDARDLIAALSAGTTRPDAARVRLAATGLSPPWSIALWTSERPREDSAAAPPPSAATAVTRINTDSGRRAAVLHGALWLVSSGPPPRPDAAGLSPGCRHTRTEPTDDVEVLLAHAEESRALCRYGALLPVLGADGPWSRETAVAAAHLPRRSLERLARRAATLSPAHRSTVTAVGSTISMQAAADSMYVHRNTLLQRVERIRSLTGLDIRRGDDRGSLDLALYALTALGESHIHAG
ncbi:sugar diacid recognition domain-containing protein [Nocardiopsis kunsanensis]|uniref:sugar diacid recognition domain-containing protein n=1 Tax=Nocardiopsis kunsanensis TaxID=141693 RepID=UPI000348CA7C|nr:sugar diacid recognition domain-containing protein [Nocardiopsis kunsanensis]